MPVLEQLNKAGIALSRRRALSLITLLWVFFLCYLALTPRVPSGPANLLGGMPQAGHFVTHLILAVLVYLLFSREGSPWGHKLRAATMAVGVSFLLGGSLEALQVLQPDRSGEFIDLVFNTSGALAGLAGTVALEMIGVGHPLITLAATVAIAALIGLTMASLAL